MMTEPWEWEPAVPAAASGAPDTRAGVMRARLEARFDDAFGTAAPTRLIGDADADADAAVTRAFARRAVHGPRVLASAPGRLELAGNHVDHQGGQVISSAIDERLWGLAAPNGLPLIRLAMEGFGRAVIDLSDPGWAAPKAVERGTSAALMRGMAAAFARAGHPVRGLDLATASDVPAGAGLSSSAAFEMMAGACLEALFGGAGADAVPSDPVALALAGCEAEGAYFGKGSGAQDQLASACGGVLLLDFSGERPVVTPVPFDAAGRGYALVLVDSRHDHSLHTDEFCAIPADMRAVANLLGGARLGDVPPERFFASLRRVRQELGDLRAMRALHYYDEVRRVSEQRLALTQGDFRAFLAAARVSGASSAQFLQSVSSHGEGGRVHQPAMAILGLCSHLLGERGAWRIHGGGFGGSVLAFVPADELAAFTAAVDDMLGYPACSVVEAGAPGVWARAL